MAGMLFLSGCVGENTNRENPVTLVENEAYEVSASYEVSDTSSIMISGYVDLPEFSANYGINPSSIVLTARGGHFATRSVIDQKELAVGDEMQITSDRKNKSISIKRIYFGTKNGQKRAMANVIIRENP